MIQEERVLVVSAHAADYVWRSGGTIAKYIKEGAKVSVVVLSCGVRGESNDLWKQEGQTSEQVEAVRTAETTKAASILGVKDFEMWHRQDYPIVLDSAAEERMVRKIREFRPTIVISHDKKDVLNFDHNRVSDFVWRCCIMANSKGVILDGTVPTKQMRIYGFEPHQTELSGYLPAILIDITDTYEKKKEAMNCFQAQGHLIQYYSSRSEMRGNHARRWSGTQECRYAESFCGFAPIVSKELY